MILEFNEKEIGSLRHIVDELLTTIYHVILYEDTPEDNIYEVECTELYEDDFNFVVKLAKQLFSPDELKEIIDRVYLGIQEKI